MYCGECGHECEFRAVDRGIGAYEFWGAKGFDTQMTIESACCGAEVYEDEDMTIPYNYSDYIDDYEAERERDYDY